ncbi:hypothetical protein [Exiguobacterium flavidum]|uniref:hypothetical protein n=1 Tax=Exiguobacterium flavidum TaxID=2184695 RepID=UPI000DF74A8A|nr:hypothetical protein [Exiguobacterium flavidum]
MKKRNMITLAGVFVAGLVLSGCNDTKHAEHQTNAASSQVEVDVKIAAKTDSGEAVRFLAVSKVDGKTADSLEDVTFEIWPAGKKDSKHEKIKAEMTKTGNYEANQKFDVGDYEGLYHINDKNGIHHMDKLDFTVMDHSHEEANEEEGHSAGHSHSSGLSIHYAGADKANVGEELPVAYHIFKDQKVLKANVQVEMIEEGVEKHTYIPLKLVADQYEGTLPLIAAGKTTLRLHVENAELHHHEDQIIEVSSN